jgi:hypothetical protein
MSAQLSNVFNNSILPFDFRRDRVLAGSIQLVVVEVVISKLLRKILGMGNRGLIELAAIHTVALPFLGGLAGFFDPVKNAAHSKFADAAADGAKGIPAIFFSQYLINTAMKGIHVPQISMKEALVTAASKVLSRPLIVAVYPKLHASLQNNVDTTDLVVNLQQKVSNLNMG